VSLKLIYLETQYLEIEVRRELGEPEEIP